MTILATIWLITKWLFIAATIVVLTLFLLFLFHPLRFDLNLRSTIKGQRGQLWFVYFFRIIRVGVIASPHTQDIFLKIFFWKIRLKRFQRGKPEDTPPKEPPEKPEDFDSSDKPDNETKDAQDDSLSDSPEKFSEKVETDSRKTSSEEEDKKVDNTKSVAHDYASETESKTNESKSLDKPDNLTSESEEPGKPEQKTEEKSKEDSTSEPCLSELSEEQSEIEDAEVEEASEKQPSSYIDLDEEVKPLSETDPFEKEKTSHSQQYEDLDEPPKKGEKTTVTIRKRLRQLRKKFSQKYLMGKKWLKIGLKKYKLFKPILKKLWRRAKAGLEIKNSAVMLKYALHEPYLTGMLQGNLSIFSGVMQRFGIEFVPVPLFGQPTIYTRAKTAAIIKPWRFVIAFILLFFEKTIWKESYNLFKWYRAQNK